MPGATAGVRLVDDAAIDAAARLLDITRGQGAGFEEAGVPKPLVEPHRALVLTRAAPGGYFFPPSFELEQLGERRDRRRARRSSSRWWRRAAAPGRRCRARGGRGPRRSSRGRFALRAVLARALFGGPLLGPSPRGPSRRRSIAGRDRGAASRRRTAARSAARAASRRRWSRCSRSAAGAARSRCSSRSRTKRGLIEKACSGPFSSDGG